MGFILLAIYSQYLITHVIQTISLSLDYLLSLFLGLLAVVVPSLVTSFDLRLAVQAISSCGFSFRHVF